MTDAEFFDACKKVLKRELVPAMGCTEPIAIAYASALARDALGEEVVSAEAVLSRNIIKNVKSVIVPHTGGLKGIAAAIAVGVVAGVAEKKLEAISDVTQEQIDALPEYMERVPVAIFCSESPFVFDLTVVLRGAKHWSRVRIVGKHTNVVSVERDGLSLHSGEIAETSERSDAVLTVEGILRFASQLSEEEGAELFGDQIELNMRIAEEGLRGDYGANIGKTLLSVGGTYCKERAYAAAASDARMSGCELPVVINSGSGNQGITSSVPVIVYARSHGISDLMLYRALAVSNLVTIHLKTGIGTLSAYCGAIAAGVGCAAGIAFLVDNTFRTVAHTIANAVAINSGVICDGAKPSCAAKIASAIDAGLLGMEMILHGNQFYGGDGIVRKGVENTIAAIGCLAHDGMDGTDREIIRLMTEDC